MLSRSPAEKSIYFASTTKIRQVCNSSFQYILQLFKSLFPLFNVLQYINNDKQIVSKLVCKFAATGQVCLEVNITDKRPLHYEICVVSGIGYDTYGPICLFILNICFFITFSACNKNRYSSPLNFREVYNSCKI